MDGREQNYEKTVLTCDSQACVWQGVTDPDFTFSYDPNTQFSWVFINNNMGIADMADAMDGDCPTDVAWSNVMFTLTCD
jgi:hypothetical protein